VLREFRLSGEAPQAGTIVTVQAFAAGEQVRSPASARAALPGRGAPPRLSTVARARTATRGTADSPGFGGPGTDPLRLINGRGCGTARRSADPGPCAACCRACPGHREAVAVHHALEAAALADAGDLHLLAARRPAPSRWCRPPAPRRSRRTSRSTRGVCSMPRLRGGGACAAPWRALRLHSLKAELHAMRSGDLGRADCTTGTAPPRSRSPRSTCRPRRTAGSMPSLRPMIPFIAIPP